MIETVIALLMLLQGNVIEHTYKEKLSDCLKSKRIAMREVNPQSVRFMCKKVEAETFFKHPSLTWQDLQKILLTLLFRSVLADWR